MSGQSGTASDPFDAAIDRAVSAVGAALPGGGGGAETTPEDKAAWKGRLPAPAKLWRWLGRNSWRLVGAWLAFGFFVWRVVVGPLLVGAREVFPFRDLVRGAATWTQSWSGGGQPLGPSKFDACWAGVPAAQVCGPSTGEGLRLAVLAGCCLAAGLVWWRICELPATGDSFLAPMIRDRRRKRVLGAVVDRWYYACVQMGWLAPHPRWKTTLDRLVKYDSRPPRPAAELRKPSFDMTGGVCGELVYAEGADVYQFERPRNEARLKTYMRVEVGHDRRLPRAPRPVRLAASLAVGERRTVVTPRSIFFGPHELGDQYRRVRFAYPDLPSHLLPCDTDPAPDQCRVRVALASDVVYWDRRDEVHAGIWGPTGSGKGMILRHMAWQVLQIGQLVVVVDGQASGEHALFQGLPNYWWFDPDAYRDQWGRGLAPWVLAGLSPDLAAEAQRLPQDYREMVAHLVYVRNQLLAVVMMGRARNGVYRRNLGQPWFDWSAADQAANPLVNVFVDEGNTLIMKGGGPGKVGEELRREIGALLGLIAFGGRKFGICAAFCGQTGPYSMSHMAKGMYAQLGCVLATGSLVSQHQQQVSGFGRWPAYPSAKGYGIKGTYASGDSVVPVRFPPAWPREYKPLVDDLRARVASTVQP